MSLRGLSLGDCIYGEASEQEHGHEKSLGLYILKEKGQYTIDIFFS